MAWLNSPRFPEDISIGSSGGPILRRTRVQTRSGRRYTNEDWDYPLHQYNVAYGVRRPNEVYALTQYFLAVGANKFRYQDFADYKSCPPDTTPAFNDQPLGTGNGTQTDFPIFKQYVAGSLVRYRPILTPVTTGFLVGVDGVNQGSGWSLQFVNNIYIVRFNSAPGNNLPLTWGGEFDVPCEFGVDELPVSFDNRRLRSTNVPVHEVRSLT